MSGHPSIVASHEITEDVFLSYSSEDRPMAEAIRSALQKEKVSVFIDRTMLPGKDWREELEKKLRGAKCIIVLWSRHSAKSRFVLDEADSGDARQILIPVRIDDVELPFGFRTRYQTADLRPQVGGVAAPGWSTVIAGVQDLLQQAVHKNFAGAKTEALILAQKSVKTEHISVSRHEVDMEAVLKALPDAGPEVIRFIKHGYSQLGDGQDTARNVVDDLAPVRHYAAAAAHFKEALNQLGPKADEIARPPRSVRYFLTMELANALAFSEPKIGQAHNEAIKIYTELSEDERYRDDPPVFFRLGSALARSAHNEETFHAAIRYLNKARRLARAAEERTEKKDDLLGEGEWIHFDVPRQIGICFARMADLAELPEQKRISYLSAAIQHSHEVVARAEHHPKANTDEFIKFTVLKAKGNFIYLAALMLRAEQHLPEYIEAIRALIQDLRSSANGDIVNNQVRIIDSIIVGASTIGDWETAQIESRRNVENLRSIAIKRELDGVELEMLARAREVNFFTQRLRPK